MMRQTIGIGMVGLIVSGVAVASPWSLSVGLGSAIAADARSGARAEIATVRTACGCAVAGGGPTHAGYGLLALGYRVSRWIAVQGTAFGEPTFQGALSLSGGGTTAPATITDRITGGTLLALAHHRFAGSWAWAAGAGVAVTRDSESGSITVNGVTHTVPAAVTTRVSPAVSASISYALTRRWSVGASYVEITSVGRQGQQYTAGPLGLASVTGTYTF